MNLPRQTVVASLALLLAATETMSGQTVRTPHGGIRPYVTLAGAAGISQTRARARGNHTAPANPVLDLSIGARKQLSRKFGIVVSTNAGKNFDSVIGGDELSCRVLIEDGAPTGCLPTVPMLDWAGVSAGGEMYVGRVILGLQIGASSYGTRDYERNPTTGAKAKRELGTRSQFDAVLPIFQQLGVTFSAVHRDIPSMLGDRMYMDAIGVGLTFQSFR